ncbi:alpha/beta hydrolase [Nocardia sp. NPDC050712]|uniref:alpha/beta fold hydrolase n=1 Tax=Nocardia sp. NPDC050712 TaxID=3155518 RepID=UPI0033D6D959
MLTDDVQIHGRSGQPVLLLPGGAETCDGFFPGLAEGLVADPGCWVIVHDRPGTGASTAKGSLATAAADLAALIAALGCGPVVVVGQSLGGAVAVLLAIEYPEVVAGLVLLDPTPINDARLCRQLDRTMGTFGAIASIPLGRTMMQALLRSSIRRKARRTQLRPDCAEAIDRLGDIDLTQLITAVRGIAGISANLDENRIPHRPAVVIAADRKRGSAVTRAHTRLAAALAAPLVCWPDAQHHVHLSHPDETLAAVRDLIARIAAPG